MLVIADSRMPDFAKKTLSQLTEVLWISPQKAVYESIAGHPDIFFCKTKAGLIAAKELPHDYFEKIQKYSKHAIIKGQNALGATYPQTAIYNALATESLLIHHIKHTAPEIRNQYATEQQIQVNQAYTRCNLIALSDHYFITSDLGILKTLQQVKKEVLYLSPQQIMLPGHQHGFFGGCCGIFEDQLVICGHVDFIKEKDALQNFTKKAGFTIKSLYYGKLIDVGSLLFV